MIRCLPNHSIDRVLWDKTISESSQPFVYALSWYLDVVSPKWSALIYGNYDYVMPLPISRKWLIPYIVQPTLTQQLGIFSKTPIPPDIQKLFESKLGSYISVRYCSNIQLVHTRYKVTQRVNYILPIESSYNTVQQNFSENCKRNIKKSETHGIVVEQVTLEFFAQHFQDLSVFDISPQLWNTIQLVLTKAQQRKSLHIYGAFYNNRICALAAFVSNGSTLYYLIPGANAIAKKFGAAYAIVARCIQEHAGTYAFLDFEGSEIAGVAQFYKGFGGQIQTYFYIQKHSIPFLSLLLKN